MDLKEVTNNSNRHPWELSRAKIMIKVFFESLTSPKSINIADIGCGDRFFIDELTKELNKREFNPKIYAVDKRYEEANTNHENIILLNDISLLADNSLDCILMMDVLEHIEYEYLFLEIARQKLKSEGLILVTVPAYQSLYSRHDVYLEHIRRYNLRSLNKLLTGCGFKTTKSHYFYSLLVIARIIQKIIWSFHNKNDFGAGSWKYLESGFLTKIIVAILYLDYSLCSFLNRVGVPMFGLSLLAISKKSE